MSENMEGKWFKIWFEDKQMLISAMYRNIEDDLEAGYNPLGKSITDQRSHLEEFIRDFNFEMDHIKEKTKQQVEHWCYYDLKKRGAIE